MPNQAAWPKEGMPPGPIMKCRLAANSIATAASVPMASTQAGAASGASAASSSSPAPGPAQRGRGRAHQRRRADHRAVHRRARPSSPFGRTASTAAITRNTSTSVIFGSTMIPAACSTAISRLAR